MSTSLEILLMFPASFQPFRALSNHLPHLSRIFPLCLYFQLVSIIKSKLKASHSPIPAPSGLSFINTFNTRHHQYEDHNEVWVTFNQIHGIHAIPGMPAMHV
eukprot:Sdes_comp20114_c0_seq1m13144